MKAALQATAYHEAGHAVVSMELGRGFRKVTIVPSGDTLGHCRNTPWGKTQPDVDAYSPRARGRIETAIIILFAGGLAEGKFCGRRNHRGADSTTTRSSIWHTTSASAMTSVSNTWPGWKSGPAAYWTGLTFG